ncbi:MAG: hypothetical protein KCHDKBKB_01220 [Elusimicrobia bacterium]|nr:hypothetical protein [Elusimicrobiota bacterium]
MKKLLALLLTFLIIIQAPVPLAWASFDDQGGSARAPGMADVYTAISDDADSIAYNPAGLIQLQEGQITSQYGQVVKGLGDGSELGTTYLGYALPLNLGYRALGFAYHNFKGDNLFNERTIMISYGHRLDLEQYGMRGIYSIGGNLKQLHRQYQQDRFTENALNDAGVGSNQQDQLFTKGTAKDSYAADFGALAQFGPKYQYTAGLAIINLNQPDVSIGGDGDRAPRALKYGLAYRPAWGTIAVESRQVERLLGQKDQDLAFGLERNIPFATMGALILRGGYASGSRGYKAMTMGLSYLFSRFRLDYAFGFPVGNLSETTGTHRLGFAVKLGNASQQFAKDYSNIDLLKAFAYDSLSAHVILTRFSLDRNLPSDHKDQLMMLLLRKYSLDDEGFRSIRSDLRDLIRKHSADLMEWPQLKFALLKGIPDDDKAIGFEALETSVRNNPKSTLMKLAVMPVNVQKLDRIAAITAMTLAELAAQTYRRNELENCIDYVRRLVEMMPTDEVVTRAYRELLARRAKINDVIASPETESLKVIEELPEAPAALVAPVPQQVTPPITTEQKKMSDKDMAIQAFGAALGYYMLRKSAGAPAEELIILLNQMKALYGEIGIDMSLVDMEITNLKTTLKDSKTTPATETKPNLQEKSLRVQPVKTVPEPKSQKKTPPLVEQPVIKSGPVVKPTPVAKPRPAAVSRPSSGFKIPVNADLKRAWEYYDEVSQREITDHERLELLTDMLKRFGEQGASRINKELERIRRRVQQ